MDALSLVTKGFLVSNLTSVTQIVEKINIEVNLEEISVDVDVDEINIAIQVRNIE